MDDREYWQPVVTTDRPVAVYLHGQLIACFPSLEASDTIVERSSRHVDYTWKYADE